ncbi:MAG TPA: T9SS type A sorting domain-containing protein, partial [Hanamia sp.]
AFLNTTTRASSSYPNSCGTSGGAKDWFIHILMSDWLSNNVDYMKYISHSYTTLGNDGNRLSISENDSTTNGKNLSAPSNVVNAIFQLSDKYPIMLDLAVTYDSTGISPTNPVTSVNSITPETEKITVNNPVENSVVLHFPADNIGQKCMMTCYDICGRNLFSEQFIVGSTTLTKTINLIPGTYLLRIKTAKLTSICRIVKF